jgi:PPOX class probable F420-dependent enzyme
MSGLHPELRALLDAPNIVHIATVLPDGGPHSVAIWAGAEGDRVAFFTQESSRKARNLERDARVAMSVVDRDNPYKTAWLRGRVATTLHGEPALEVIDRLSHKYTGGPFPMRSGVVFLVEVLSSNVLSLPFRDTPPVG